MNISPDLDADLDQKSLTLREATLMDKPLLEKLYWEAERWGGAKPEDEISDTYEDELDLYVGQWTPDQGGVILEHIDEDGTVTPLGGSWLRNFTELGEGGGFYRADYPELAIALLPGNTGQGYGPLVIRGLVDFARSKKLHGVSLQVEKGNDPAQRMYEAQGFSVAGPDHWNTGEVMYLPLSDESPES